MTYEHRRGDIFDSGADALVDPVNCVGESGKGLALAFKQRFPEAEAEYRALAERGAVNVGRVSHVFMTSDMRGTPVSRIFFFFPTKVHWRQPPHISYVESGLDDLADQIADINSDEEDVLVSVRTIAIPALGCGLGGLRWEDVRPLIEAAARRMFGAHVLNYGPM